jgi:hypothetical protein
MGNNAVSSAAVDSRINREFRLFTIPFNRVKVGQL